MNYNDRDKELLKIKKKASFSNVKDFPQSTECSLEENL